MEAIANIYSHMYRTPTPTPKSLTGYIEGRKGFVPQDEKGLSELNVDLLPKWLHVADFDIKDKKQLHWSLLFYHMA